MTNIKLSSSKYGQRVPGENPVKWSYFVRWFEFLVTLMVSNISKNNRTIFNIFILRVSIGGFFNAVNCFTVFLVSLRVTENVSFQANSFL